ncbi:glutamate mutase S-chain [Micromonospora sp. ATCC 39149]|uniref:cobalamin B12-binding domain-containing protein n=1 Tax=Micromonospora sp. (strain ATCC 39149 / NRRL 15099 / SCC 1413) TaxID=219305 RepID=UPI0001A50924|nr:cobalamin-dependent protein [Micromonospora sp. ATCC 39149]EEP74802.1 glutamate mutase S-chain [Micromonospora sp. ATCC 39149]
MTSTARLDPHPAASRDGHPTAVVSSMASDAHTWNLVFLQLLVEELGFEVTNLGPCVPDRLLVEQCRIRRPALVVLSSVNGHGYQDGLRVIGQLRGAAGLAGMPIVLGGKLGVSGEHRAERVAELRDAGFDAVYDDRPDAIESFRRFVAGRVAVGRP